MVSTDTFQEIALSLEEAVKLPHFEKISFRVNKKIFATLDLKNKRACLKLNSLDQSVFSDFDPQHIYPVPGAWGKKGFTFFELAHIRKDLLKDALATAFCEVAPQRLSSKVNTTRMKKVE